VSGAYLGDDRERLFQDNRKLIFSALRHHFADASLDLIGREDAEQEAAIALWQATGTFDPTSGGRFTSYAYTAIRRQVLTKLKKARARRKGSLLLDDNEEPVVQPSEESSVEVQAEIGEQVAVLLEQLRPPERALVRRRFGLGCRPETLAAIGQRLGITRERVRQRLVAILRKLREAADAT
jgi:RNA polymerase sigma factor (sigma-70 family)